MIDTKVHHCLESMISFIESAHYAGYDPYDALSSPVLRHMSRKSKWLRIAFTQFLRRCPLNLRPLLGIKKCHNPKGIGLFLWGYAKLYALEQKAEHLDRINYLLDLLDQLRSPGYSGNCWGHNFDWQNRVMFVPKYTPTIVNSAFIGHALLDTYLLCHVQRALDLAGSITAFIVNDLNRHCEGDRFCFSYTPADHNFVHNANLLGASLLIRLHRIRGDYILRDLALASMSYSLNHQRSDGAWKYAERQGQDWIDSFHTGFNLQAMQYFIDEGYGSLCRRQYDLGLAYYEDHFFLADGTPKYYDRCVWPIDVHSPCQAIVVFTHEAGQKLPLATRVVTWTLDYLYSRQGYFYFRKGRFLSNRIQYMRWSQAWAFHALTSFFYHTTKSASKC